MIRKRPRAIYAIIEIADYICIDSPASAERFLDAVEETFHELEVMPGLGHPYEGDNPRTRGIRVWSVKGFRSHLVFYKQHSDGIEVLTIIHGARDIPRVLLDELER